VRRPDDDKTGEPGSSDKPGRSPETPGRKPRRPRRPRPSRPIVPSPDTVVAETKLVSPKGRVYRVLRTNQKDPYDEPAGEPPPPKGARRPKR
jgi:hypothetical protein